MGTGHAHVVDVDAEYHLLQERLDRNVTGAPDSAVFQRILRLLFTPEDAHLARQIGPMTSLDRLAARTGLPPDELEARLDALARKGLVFDLRHDGHRFYSLAPVVIGFYEFTFMRTGADAPSDEVAELFEEYFDDERFGRSIFRANTQIGRSLVREEALPEPLTTEVLDWERATAIVTSARSVAVANCPCRVHAHQLGRGCDAPVRTCLSFNGAADSLVRAGFAEAITNAEGLAILAEAKTAGLAQTGDNVQGDVSYLCNCCGCCCGMMRSLKRYDIPHAIVPSNWLATIDHERCRGCGRCVKACPADAIHLELTHGKGLRRTWAVVDEDRCLGCGVCHNVCRYDAHAMTPRAKRPYVPVTTVERIAAMAIERGKLGDLLYDATEHRGAHAVARILHVLEHTPVHQAVMAIEPVRSVFLSAMLRALGDEARRHASPKP